MSDNNMAIGDIQNIGTLDHAKLELAHTAVQFDGALMKLTGLISLLEKRTASLEKTIQQRVTISSAQARAVQRAVSDRAKALCEDHDLPYEQYGSRIRDAIWRAFRTEYAVPTAYDLPETQYASALETVRGWSSFVYMRKLKRVAMLERQ